MEMNFSYSNLSSKIFSSCVSSDGYEITNLTSNDTLKRSKGFQAERFSRVPVYVSIEFYVPIQLKAIVIRPYVGQQCAKTIKVLSSNKELKSEDKLERLNEISFNVATAMLVDQSNVAFVNKDYKNHHSLCDSSSVENNTAHTVSMQGRFTNVTAIKVGILQMLRGSVPSIRSLDVWGCPSFRCDKRLGYEIIHKWKQLTVVKNKDQKPSKYLSDKFIENSIDQGTSVNDGTLNADSKINESSIPDQFLDPLVCIKMQNPVLLPSGHTIDQRTLDKHIKAQAEMGRCPSDPFTGIVFTDKKNPVPNVKLKLLLDKHALESSDLHKVGKDKTVCLLDDKEIWTKRKRSISHENPDNVKIRKINSGHTCSSTDISISSSLESTLSAARLRYSYFRTVQLNDSSGPNNIYCAKCNTFLSSSVVQYALPCEHKLCRTCCLKTSTDPNADTKLCPSCKKSFLKHQVYRTFA